MSAVTGIEWTDRTWNPTRGCSIVSPGCVNCYAMKQAHRFSGVGKAYEGLTKVSERSGPQWTGKVTTVEPALLEPLSWRTPAKVFVNSMSDLFHDAVPDAFVDRVFTVMALSPWHTYQVLTKRADRMREYVTALTLGRLVRVANLQPNGRPVDVFLNENLTTIARRAKERAYRHEPHLMPMRMVLPLPNVWLGVSVENQQYADERLPLLLQTPASVRFISAEPLIGPVSFRRLPAWLSSARGASLKPDGQTGHLDGLSGIHWVIVGGESGSSARPFRIDWARVILEECRLAGVACFIKQVGKRPSSDDPTIWPSGRITPYPWLDATQNDSHGGDPAEWPEDLRVREFPA